MRTLTPILLAPLFLSACSETGIGSEQEPQPPPEPRVEYEELDSPRADTGSVEVPDVRTPEESSCDLASVDPSAVAVTECRERDGDLRFTEKWRTRLTTLHSSGSGVASILTAGFDGTKRGASIIFAHDTGEGASGPRILALKGTDGSLIDERLLDPWDSPHNGQWVAATDETGIRPGGFLQKADNLYADVDALRWQLDGRVDTYFSRSLRDLARHPPSFAAHPLSLSTLHAGSAALLDVTGNGYGDLLYGGRWTSAGGEGVVLPRSARLMYPTVQGRDGSWQSGLPMPFDLDGEVALAVGRRIYRVDGTHRCSADTAEAASFVGDFDGDGVTDILGWSTESVFLLNTDCEIVRERPVKDVLNDALPTWEVWSPVSLGPHHFRVVPGRDGAARLWFILRSGVLPHVEEMFGSYYLDGALRVRSASPWIPAVAETDLGPVDLEGDGLYEVVVDGVIYSEGEADPVSRLPEPDDTTYSVLHAFTDVDHDGHGELIVREVSGVFTTDREVDIVVYEGHNLAPASKGWHTYGYNRAGYFNDDGTFVKPEDWPPWSRYNSIGVPEYDAEWEGFGVDLELTFLEVCPVECHRDRLRTTVQVANHGTVDLIRPVEVQLLAEVDGETVVADSVRLDRLESGQRTGSLELTARGKAAYTGRLSIDIKGVGDFTPDLCAESVETVWDGAVCEE